MSDIINLSENIVKTADTTLNFIEKILDKAGAIRDKKLSVENYLRAYYLEVVNNIEFLNIFNIEILKKSEINDKSLQYVINNIRTDLGAAILFDDELKKQTNVYKFLKDKGQINNKEKLIVKSSSNDDTEINSKYIYENVLQAISFTVIKTEILRKIVSMQSDELKLLSNISINRRLYNLKERFIMIKLKLDKLDGIKEIAR